MFPILPEGYLTAFGQLERAGSARARCIPDIFVLNSSLTMQCLQDPSESLRRGRSHSDKPSSWSEAGKHNAEGYKKLARGSAWARCSPDALRHLRFDTAAGAVGRCESCLASAPLLRVACHRRLVVLSILARDAQETRLAAPPRLRVDTVAGAACLRLLVL